MSVISESEGYAVGLSALDMIVERVLLLRVRIPHLYKVKRAVKLPLLYQMGMILMKMTMEMNKELQVLVIRAEGITMQVSKIDRGYNNYVVITSTGISKICNGIWDFENYTQTSTDIEKYLFKIAYEYFELLDARKQAIVDAASAEINSENEEKVEDPSTNLPF